MKRISIILLALIIIVLGLVAWQWRGLSFFTGESSQRTEIATANYLCDAGKTIAATYYQGPTAPTPAPGEPPTPTGSVHVVLSDGRTLDLPQTLSGSGIRYSNGNPNVAGSETFVFWSKGNGAFVLENNQDQTYTGCVKVAENPGTLPNVFESGSSGFSLRYPDNYKVDDTYQYQEMGPGKSISGIKFTIDPLLAQGTNLNKDSYFSVEEIASTTDCTADKFLDLGNRTKVTTINDNGTTYSFASTTGAAAGNRYEEQVYVIPGTNPCIAVRYLIHYGVLENYPAGMVKEFDEAAVLAQFDAMRRSLTIAQ